VPEHEIGVVGLATMGQNLARNLASRGVRVAVYNRTRRRTDDFMAEYSSEGDFRPAGSLEELARILKPPRAILLMVKAGSAVDEAIDSLSGVLEPGDTIIDGGNSLFHDTRRRSAAAEKAGLGFIGAGVSGGEEGALRGPSIMPGGTRASYERVAKMLTSISAMVDGVPCCTYIGPDGAGHFVKMVHNGIEYADIQLIAETYDFLRQSLGMTPPELASVFREWNQGELQSYLIEITANVLAKGDGGPHSSLVDAIDDEAEQKGTGRWTSQSALELGVPLTGITEAVFARMLSSQKAERINASTILKGPTPPLAQGGAPGTGFARPGAPRGDVPPQGEVRRSRGGGARQASTSDAGLVDDVRDALYASKIVAYAQGFEHLRAGSREFGWDLDLGALATIWRGGCIIRAQFLDRIKDAYAESPDLPNLMLAPFFQQALASAQQAWRSVTKQAIDQGVPIPAFASSLAYYDGYRRARGPANLIQGLRDYFGAHTYHRVDREGAFHTRWAQDGTEVQVD
jgi:6-phosphogluconate dehydrogenase